MAADGGTPFILLAFFVPPAILAAMSDAVAVIGGGSWGTALAALLARKGCDVLLWAFEEEVARGIREDHKNPYYLNGIDLPPALRATHRIEEALAGRMLVLSVVPSRFLRSVWQRAAAHLAPETLLLSCTKGIEIETLERMSEVLADCLPDHPAGRRAVLSGPSFAREVAAELPTSVVIAAAERSTAERFQGLLRTEDFLTFRSDDVVGVEVGGAVKNVIAIAAGVAEGLALGNNARAAIITRGLYEMIKIGQALGAKPLTFSGLSGIGDLALTCTGSLSRNHELGMALGRGETLAAVTGRMRMEAEGVHTAEAVDRLANRHRLHLPICAVTHRILFEGLPPREALRQLCTMPLKEELGAIAP